MAELYEKLIAEKANIEIVFISSDSDEDAFRDYFQSHPWVALPYSSDSLRQKLGTDFKVKGIPTLIGG